MSSHSIFAPSSAYRNIVCPRSLRLAMRMPNRETEAAAEGTCAHHLAERCLKGNLMTRDFYGTWFHYMGEGVVSEDPMDFDSLYSFECDDEMVQYIHDYCVHCLSRPGSMSFVEVRVDISPWTPIPKQGGTSDHVSIDVDNGVLYIDDLKYGKIKVKPQENWQAISYALGVLHWLRTEHPDIFSKITKVVVGIYQPRIDNIDEWETTVERIFEMGEYMKKRYDIAWNDEDAPYGPDAKACEFCPVVKCKAQIHYLRSQMPVMEGAPLEEFKPDQEFLSDDEAAEFMLLKLWYEKIFKKLHDYLFKRVSDGRPNSVVRLGEGKGKRFWKDRKEAERILKAAGVHDLYSTPEFNTPAVAEKKVKGATRKALQDLIGKVPGSPRLVPVGSDHKDHGQSLREEMPNLEEDEFGL